MNTLTDLHPTPLPDVLRRQLAPGEQLLWHGRPPQGLVLRDGHPGLVFFSLFWCGFALHWEWQALSMEGPRGFALFGVPFVLFGLYMVLGRFWVNARVRARTHYALTPERVLLAGGWDGQQVKTLPLHHLPLELKLHGPHGGGTIALGNSPDNPMTKLPTGWPGAPLLPPRLELDSDAQRVFQLIQQAQRQSP